MNSPKTKSRVTVGEFFSGLFAALADQGHRQVYRCGERFNEAVTVAFKSFDEEIASQGFKPSFVIILNPFYGDSEAIEQGLIASVTRDLISHLNPSFEQFQLNLAPEEASEILKTLPGGPELYRSVAEKFFDHYSRAHIPA